MEHTIIQTSNILLFKNVWLFSYMLCLSSNAPPATKEILHNRGRQMGCGVFVRVKRLNGALALIFKTHTGSLRSEGQKRKPLFDVNLVFLLVVKNWKCLITKLWL